MKSLHVALLAGGALLLASRANAGQTGAASSGGGGSVLTGVSGTPGTSGGATSSGAGGVNLSTIGGLVNAIVAPFVNLLKPGAASTPAPASTNTTPAPGSDPLVDAYRAGNFGALNNLIQQNGVTASIAAQRYALDDTTLATMRQQGVVFANDQVSAAAAASAPAIDWTPIYSAYEASDFATLNAELAAQGVSADEAAQKYNLNEAFIGELERAGVVFAA